MFAYLCLLSMWLVPSPRMGVWDTLVSWVKWAFGWIVKKLSDLADVLMDGLVGLLPASVELQWDWIGDYAAALNAWVPVQEFFSLLLILWVFQLGFAMLKIAVKLIPTIG